MGLRSYSLIGHKLFGSALRILIAWIIALQPMVGAYSASASANAPLAMELCRGVPAPNQDVPDDSGHAKECCLACAPAPAPPPDRSAELPVPSVFFGTVAASASDVFVAAAGLGPQSARDPPR